MKTKQAARQKSGKRRRRRDRDLAALAKLGVKVRCSPTADYLHPLGPALVAEILKWLPKHRLKVSGVMKRAQLSRETLRKLISGRSWFSLNVAARICEAMGLDFIGALIAAARRCGRLQRKKCQL
jgi:DNA-binding phage protein